jgi:hypothetical protein
VRYFFALACVSAGRGWFFDLPIEIDQCILAIVGRSFMAERDFDRRALLATMPVLIFTAIVEARSWGDRYWRGSS